MKKKLCDVCKSGHNGIKCSSYNCACELCNRDRDVEKRKMDYRDNMILGLKKYK